MTSNNCEERAQRVLERYDTAASPEHIQDVAREMCRLLDSSMLAEDVDGENLDLGYLVERLDIREGSDDPPISEEWNHWLGMMNYVSENDYKQFQV